MASEGAAGDPAWTALDLADFDAIHRVNVGGTFVVNQQAGRRVREGGSIVNVSSTVVWLAPPTQSESGMCRKGKSIVFTGGNTGSGKATAPPLRRAVPM